MSALPARPSGWDTRLSNILDGDFNYFVVERCWLMAGLTEAGDKMGSLGSLFYCLASQLFLLASSLLFFFCILILCDFI